MKIELRFEKFIKETLIPTEEEEKQIKSKVKKLENMMKHNMNIPIAETIYGGSYAKNTILKGRKEVDIVFILSSRYPEKKIDELKDDLVTFLSEIQPIYNVKKNPRSISFNYEGIEIDLLVAKKFTKHDALKNMPIKQQERFYGASTKFQVKIAKERGSKFQNTVRLLKYCINQNEEKLCSSFLIELITAYVFDENKESSYPDLFIKVLEFIVETRLNISLVFNYNGETSYSSVEKTEQAIITDPGNPENNILDSVKNIDELIEYAKKTLELAKEQKWEEVFKENFPNEVGVVRRRANNCERKSQHPPDAPERRYG